MQAFQNKDYSTTIHMCNMAMSNGTHSKDLVHLMALSYAEMGDKEKAIAAFRQAINIDNRFLPARNNYGIFLHKIGEIDEAKQNFEQCILIDPKYADPYYHLGEILKEKGDLDGAIDHMETAVRLKPNYFDAQRDLGLAIYDRVMERMTSRSVNESLDALQKAARLSPENPLIWYYIGKVQCADGKLDEGESMFRTALSKDARLAAAHWELGRVRYLRADPDRCISEVKAATKINPVYTDDHKYPKVDPVEMNRYLATCYEIKGQYGDAIACSEEVASMERNNQETLKHIIQLKKKAKSGTRHSGKQSFDPQEVQTLISKGISASEDGNLEGAKSMFEQALQLNPSSFEALQNLGATLEASGDLNGAIAKYQEAKNQEPDFAGVYYNLAYCLEKAGLGTEAAGMYQKFHDIAGRYPYDPRHIVMLQQDQVREKARNEQLKKRGY
jgi:tetratricopeptide (TPR) repeat protein